MKTTLLTTLFIACFQIVVALNTGEIQHKADSLEKFAKSVIFKTPSVSEKTGKELIQFSKNHQLIPSLMAGYNIVGLSYYYLDNSEAGTSYLDTLLKIAKQQQDTIMLNKAYNNLGMLNEQLGNFDKAFEYGIQALKLAEIIGNKTGIANSLGNLGNISIRLKKYEGAIVFLEKSEQLNKELNNKKALANQYNSLSVAYDNLNDSKKKMAYLLLAKKLYEELNDQQLTTVLINIATNYSEQKKYKEAIKINLEAKKLAENYNQKTNLGNILANLATCYSGFGDFNNAIKSINEAESLFKETDNLWGLTEVKRKRAIISQQEGNFEKATQELKEYQELKDSVIGVEKQLAVIDLQEKYEVEKKDLQLQIQQATIKEQQEKSFYTKLIFAFILIFVLLIVIVFYLHFKHKQKIKAEIEKIEAENLRKQAELEAKEKERNRLATELHDNVGSSISFMSLKIDWLLHQEQLNNNNKTEIVQLKEAAQDVISGLRETLWTLNTKSISNIDLCDKLKVYIKKHLLCSLKINDQLNHEFEIPNEDVLTLYRCSQEIINNINKHSNAKTVVVDFISVTNNELTMVFIDDGIGFNFVDKNESYGLRNLKARMEKIKGVFLVKSSLGNGTEIKISYKISA